MILVDATAISLTLKLAACTTAVLVVIGLPLAYWLATSRAAGVLLSMPPSLCRFVAADGVGLLLAGRHGAE